MKRTLRKVRIAILAAVCVLTMFGMTMEVKAGSADNSLKYIEVSEGSLSPSFAGNRLNYTVQVGADVSNVEISAKPVNAKANILSGTGTYALSEDETTVKIVVQAENGNQATYTVTIVKSGETQPADTDEPEDTPDNTTDDTEADTEPPVTTEGYTITDKPADVKIPEGFSETTAIYKEKGYPAYKFDNGNVTLFYMTNEAGEGGFFVYNTEWSNMYPFIRVDAGEQKLILMAAHAYDSLYPGVPAVMTIDGQVFEKAYQAEPGDLYQFYAMDETGAEGWYQYNSADGSFATYTMSYEIEETEDDGYLRDAYNDLNDKFNARKDRDIKIIAGLIVLVVILLFVIVNLLLRDRKPGNDGEEEEEEEDIFENKPSQKKESRLFKRKSMKEDKWVLPESVNNEEDAVEMQGLSEPAEFAIRKEQPLSDEDELMNYDEESEPFSDHKKEKKKKEKKRKNHDIFDDDEQNDLFDGQKVYMDKDDSDDDIEVMDLNDL